MRPFLITVIFFLLMPNSQKIWAQTEKEQLQVIPGELPDPSIIEVNGVYYAAGTSGDWAPIFPIYRSTDLKNWTLISHVFETNPSWTMSSFWAPELYYHNNTFYCYYTARGNDGISKIGVATTTDITKGFKDHGPLIEWGNEAIDAFVYKENTTLYITWKAYGLSPDTPIKILGSKLSDDGLSLIGEHFEELTANAQDWEKGMIEGQCIIKKDDFLYMIYSGNACCGKDCDYQIGVARSRSMEGPWEKYDANPLMISNNSWKCPGHGTVISTKGKWYYLYHAYNLKGFPSLGRAAILSELYWDEKNDWPYFKVDESSTNGERLEKNITDIFDTDKLGPWWVRNVKNSDFKVTLNQGKLILSENHPKQNIHSSGAVLCVIPNDSEFSFSAQITNQNNSLKGLVLYTTKENSLGFGTKGKSLVLWKMEKGIFSEIKNIPLKNNKGIFLKTEVDESNNLKFLYSNGGEEWELVKNPGNINGDNLAWWSSGMKVGLQVKADPESNDKEAHFDNFNISY